jgi:DNA-binding GntR family transcriptional regulator
MIKSGKSQPAFQKPATLATEIARHLRDTIIRGEIRPGERLNESRLTQELASSRSPVREAFRILEAEGLVVVQPHRGAYVRSLSERDLHDIFEVRTLFETHALRQGAERLTPERLVGMADAVAEAKDALGREAFEVWHQASLRFHDGLVGLADNSHLARFYDELKFSLRRFQIFLIQIPAQPARSQGDHEAILDALKRGDTGAGLRLLEAHIDSLEGALLRALQVDGRARFAHSMGQADALTPGILRTMRGTPERPPA